MPRNGKPFIALSMVTAGGIMEKVSVDPRNYPGYTRKDKALSMFFSAHHSFRGKIEKGDFNSSRVSSRFSISSLPRLASDPIRFFFDTRNEYLPASCDLCREIPIEWSAFQFPSKRHYFPACHIPVFLPGSRRRTGCRSISPVPTEGEACRACAGSRSRPR